MKRYRALAERLISCTCGSTAVIDPARHAENCHRRLWREAMDEIDAALATHQGAVKALEQVAATVAWRSESANAAQMRKVAADALSRLRGPSTSPLASHYEGTPSALREIIDQPKET